MMRAQVEKDVLILLLHDRVDFALAARDQTDGRMLRSRASLLMDMQPIRILQCDKLGDVHQFIFCPMARHKRWHRGFASGDVIQHTKSTNIVCDVLGCKTVAILQSAGVGYTAVASSSKQLEASSAGTCSGGGDISVKLAQQLIYAFKFRRRHGRRHFKQSKQGERPARFDLSLSRCNSLNLQSICLKTAALA